MKIRAFGLTDIGMKRQKNEDSLLVHEDMGLFVVADGMGGHKGGDVASKLAVESVAQVVKTHREEHTFLSPRAMLEEAYMKASSQIFIQSQANQQEFQGMGTTLVSAYVHKDELFLANVGDSRAYLFNQDYMWQVTEDHSLLNEHLRAGLVQEGEAKDFQGKNVLTRSVGFNKTVDCDIFRRHLSPGDRFLLCSDGLTGFVEDQDIHRICKGQDSQKAVKQCIDKANKAGGHDNITVLIIEA